MTDLRKLTKLIDKLEVFAKQLDREKNLEIHHRINQFHYLEKAAELKILLDQYEAMEMKLNQLAARMECESKKAYRQWRKDIRWLHSTDRKTVPESNLKK